MVYLDSMQRRDALKAVGTTLLSGAMITGTAAAIDGPEVTLEYESLQHMDSERRRNVVSDLGTDDYEVEYGDDGIVTVTTLAHLSSGCSYLEVDAVESTASGDVVRLAKKRPRYPCPAVASIAFVRIELEYEDVPDEVTLEIVDTQLAGSTDG